MNYGRDLNKEPLSCDFFWSVLTLLTSKQFALSPNCFVFVFNWSVFVAINTRKKLWHQFPEEWKSQKSIVIMQVTVAQWIRTLATRSEGWWFKPQLSLYFQDCFSEDQHLPKRTCIGSYQWLGDSGFKQCSGIYFQDQFPEKKKKQCDKTTMTSGLVW